MSSRYRIEYALKSHRRDSFIEWIKSLLAVPFVLHSVTTQESDVQVQGKYAEIFQDIEDLINEDINYDESKGGQIPRLRQLVPNLGTMFTSLPLKEAFYIEDERRSISKRVYVSPSFNDVRNILTTAQLLALTKYSNVGNNKKLRMITFDGDVTLYDDGMCLDINSPIVAKLVGLLQRDIYIGIVTAAGYTDGEKYYTRLQGLIDVLISSTVLTKAQKEKLLIMGGECNFMFRYNDDSKALVSVDPKEWLLPEMAEWDPAAIEKLLDFGETKLEAMSEKMKLNSLVIRKERAVGIIAKPGFQLFREQLEEIVLTLQKCIDVANPSNIKFCAFNGGSDVWLDIGDKSLGVKTLQNYIGGIQASETLHVGDQFLSLGANDFKARLVACTAWIASPSETDRCINDVLNWS